jgi:hypothetical protein
MTAYTPAGKREATTGSREAVTPGNAACQRECGSALVLPLSTAGWVAQLVEQRIENPRVGGSIPSLGTISIYKILKLLEK